LSHSTIFGRSEARTDILILIAINQSKFIFILHILSGEANATGRVSFSPFLLMSSTLSDIPKNSQDDAASLDEDEIQLVKPLLYSHASWEIPQSGGAIGNVKSGDKLEWLRVSFSYCTNVPSKGLGNAMGED